jgi:hypothetical protein
MTKADLRELLAFGDDQLRLQRETIYAMDRTISLLQQQLGQKEGWDRKQLELIRVLFGVMEAHGIECPPLPPFMAAAVMH